ncbi:MAG: hypothetical protein K5784_07475 [Clostridiales bacterium]|nr:hypothetical protein [Clostridiales bacterium]
MKKLLCALLCVCMLTAFAQETAATEQLKDFAAETVQMMTDTAVRNNIGYPVPYWDFSKLDASQTRGGAILTLSAQQAEALDSFASDDACALAVIAMFINSQFSQDYAAASYSLTQQGGNTGIETGNGVIVWLMYDYHICLCYIHADGSWESALLMSDQTVLKGFSEEYIIGSIEALQMPGEVTMELFD